MLFLLFLCLVLIWMISFVLSKKDILSPPNAFCRPTATHTIMRTRMRTTMRTKMQITRMYTTMRTRIHTTNLPMIMRTNPTANRTSTSGPRRKMQCGLSRSSVIPSAASTRSMRMNTRQTPPRILLRLPPSMRNFPMSPQLQAAIPLFSATVSRSATLRTPTASTTTRRFPAAPRNPRRVPKHFLF